MSIICTICISDIRSETSSLLTCGHLFHKHCIMAWANADQSLKRKLSCPVCKSRVLRRKIVSPVCFLSNNDILKSSDKDLAEICSLKNEAASLADECSRSELAAAHATASEEIWRKRSEECEEKVQSLDYFKQLKRYLK
ncbi:hypothetical protein BY458DRAFT_525940 [Sporodiniella umbellata]|nr:hypothetical protein BY458DRAFT_525937 [Sporodiniella umbellata]KAI9249054.1 hypothetical protein BY458DRAFT_525940 [Sporodiniella umbellata]